MTSRSNLPDPCQTNPGWTASPPFETTGHGGPCPRNGCLGETTSSRSARKGRPRCLRRTCSATQSAHAWRTPTGREGRRPHRPQEYRAQGTAPLPQGPMGGTASSRSASKGRPRTPLRNLQPHPMAGCPCELRQAGRDGVPAVRRSIGRRGLRPSRTSSNRGHPSTLASPGGTASSRSASKGRPRAPLRNLQPHPMAGCPCEPRQVGEGRRPRRPQEYRAQRTVPLPQARLGGTASSRSARMSATWAHAPPAP